MSQLVTIALRKLDASDLLLQSVPENIGDLRKLVELDLSRNMIRWALIDALLYYILH